MDIARDRNEMDRTEINVETARTARNLPIRIVIAVSRDFVRIERIGAGRETHHGSGINRLVDRARQIFLAVKDAQAELCVGRQIGIQREAAAITAEPIDALSIEDVLHVARVIVLFQIKTGAHGFTQRAAGIGADFIGIEIAVACAQPGRENIRRGRRDQVHHAADRIAAIERALRPAQKFHPVEITHQHAGRSRTREVKTIDVNGDGAFAGARQQAETNAARRDLRRSGDLTEIHPRHLLSEITHRGDAANLQIICGEGGNTGRDALHILGPLFGGDDHLLDPRTRRHGGTAGRGNGNTGQQNGKRRPVGVRTRYGHFLPLPRAGEQAARPLQPP